MIHSGYAICCLLFSNNLILNKASLEVYKVSGRWWLEFHFLALGVEVPWDGLYHCSPLGLRCGEIVVLGPRGSGSPRLVLFGDIGPVGVRDMVGGWRRFFGLVRVGCFSA